MATPTIMSPSTTVSGLEIIDLVSAHPDGIRLSQLSESVTKRFGASVTFHTSSRLGLDFDDLLVFLEARNKLRIFRGVVFPAKAATVRP
jgi:probable metal-binding protein